MRLSLESQKIFGVVLDSIFNLSKKELLEFVHYPIFQYKDVEISMLSVVTTLFIVFIGISLAKMYKYKTQKYLTAVSPENRIIIANLGYYTIISLTILISLDSIGLNLSSLAIVAGALSVGIGFGLQNIVSNFVAGIILMFEKSIRVGDLVEIDATTKGKVVDIKMRATTLVNTDNVDIIVPNSNFIQNVVTNWTMSDDIARVHILFSVAYGSDLDYVKQVVMDKLLGSSMEFLRDMEDKKPTILVTALGSSGVDFDLLIYINITPTYGPMSAKSEGLMLVYKTLHEHNIKIPFSQLDLYIKEMGDLKLSV